jgi:hypothetical protein
MLQCRHGGTGPCRSNGGNRRLAGSDEAETEAKDETAVLMTVQTSERRSSSTRKHSFGKIISTDETILHKLRFRITGSVSSGFRGTIPHPY